jgi:hypothetical protein
MKDAELFTPDEAAQLTAFLKRREVDFHQLAKVDHRFNVTRHKLAQCSWWRKGQGMLVRVPGTDPTTRLLQEE